MKTWIKGGLIGIGIEIVLLLIFSLRYCDNTEIVGGGKCSWGFNNLINFIIDILSFDITELFIAIFILVIGFIIGALVGWIYGKIKDKNKS